uniref:Uncharacterized protein n=1 Tax=Ascaris lumbricoides TaxID=6252 RepID=A0A0M3INY5_ASCLU
MRSLEEELRIAKRDNDLLLTLYREEMLRRAFAEERLRILQQRIASQRLLCEGDVVINGASPSAASVMPLKTVEQRSEVEADDASALASTSQPSRKESRKKLDELREREVGSAQALCHTRSGYSYFIQKDGTFEADSFPSLAVIVLRLEDALFTRNASFVKRSQERQMRIMEASERRAALAAEKRLLAYELLAGKVDVHSALPKLSADIGDVVAFPPSAMAHATRRRVQKTGEFVVRRSKDVEEGKRHVDRLLAFCYSQRVRAKQAHFGPQDVNGRTKPC